MRATDGRVGQALRWPGREVQVNNHGSIQIDDTTITYEVVRSARRHKTIQTQVSLDNVRVLAPAVASDLELEQVVRQQARWILERRKILSRRPAPRRFVTGETMPYLGRDFELIVDTDRFLRPWIRFDEDCFRFDAPPGMDDESRRDLIRKAFVDWYWQQAEEDLPAWVDGLVALRGRSCQTASPDPGPAAPLGKLRL